MVVHLLLGDDTGDRAAEALAGRLAVAPPHLDAEVLSAVHRLHRHGALVAEDLESCVVSLARAPIVRWEARDLVAGAHALRDQVGSYDAWYVALARQLSTSVLTADRRLARAVPQDTLVA